MANKKIKFPLWLMPDTKATVECLYRQDGCNSQSEFIEKAILFYCGYLQSEYAGDFLPKILGETLEAILSMFGDRIGKLLLGSSQTTLKVDDLSEHSVNLGRQRLQEDVDLSRIVATLGLRESLSLDVCRGNSHNKSPFSSPRRYTPDVSY